MKIGPYMDPKERLMMQIKIHESGCWLWIGCIGADGYGKTLYQGRHMKAHRVAYLLHVGPIPDGCHLHHVCQTRACVNPLHLRPLTPRDHLREGDTWQKKNAEKTHCPSGHLLSGENLAINSKGSRVCRECGRRRAQEWRARNLELARELGRLSDAKRRDKRQQARNHDHEMP
jgi:hypothetical protein